MMGETLVDRTGKRTMVAVALLGIGLTAFSGGHSSQVSSAVDVDGRTWTADVSEGIAFSSRPVTGVAIIIR